MDNAERMEILRMVENGEVSVEDAVGLMAPGVGPTATKAEAPAEQALPLPGSANAPRWLRVRVTNLETGKRKVSVNVPLKLMKWGMKFGSRFAPELDGFDMEELMADLDQYTEGHLVEVEDNEGNERVEIFVE